MEGILVNCESNPPDLCPDKSEGPKSQKYSQSKRKRLNAVVDKISHLNAKSDPEETREKNSTMRGIGRSTPPPIERKPSSAALRREQWRDTQQQSVEEQMGVTATSSSSVPDSTPIKSTSTDGVFKFDSFEKECQHKQPLCQHSLPFQVTSQLSNSGSQEQHDLFSSPISGRSPHSSLSSPQVSVDSPRICFSPLRIKDSIEEEDFPQQPLPRLSVKGCDSSDHGDTGGLPYTASPGHWLDPSVSNKLLPAGFLGAHSASRPISPISPANTPLNSLRHLPSYLTEIYRRRCLSDTDLSSNWEEGHAGGTNLGTGARRRLSPSNRRVLSQDSRDRGHQGSNVRGNSLSPSPFHPIGSPYLSTSGINATPGSFNQTRVAHEPGCSSRYLSLPCKGGSLESETSSTTTQESPLDLSIRSNSSIGSAGLALKVTSIVTGGSVDSIQQHTKRTAANRGGRSLGAGKSRASAIRGTASMERYSLDRLDVTTATTATSVVEASASGSNSDMAFICPICGQMFSMSDRLAKHMASRHKSRSTDSTSGCSMDETISGSSPTGSTNLQPSSSNSANNSKSYTCDVCKRSFARSDMLTRHIRLHTGLK